MNISGLEGVVVQYKCGLDVEVVCALLYIHLCEDHCETSAVRHFVQSA